MTKKCNIVVLIGGNGSNLQAIIDAIQNKSLNNIHCQAVISHRPGVFGLERAQKANIPALCLDHKAYASREAFEDDLHKTLLTYRPDYIVLAGFMRILSADFVKLWAGKIINIHPSLLPHYQGLNTHQRVLDAKEPLHGATVHFVTEHLDDGPIIAQAHLAVLPEDTVESLQRRVQGIEHQLYSAALAKLSSE